MSRMSELCIDIELMLEQGYNPVRIAEYLEVPITWVYESAELMDEESNTEVFSPFETVNS
jgi:hypothetical protein